MPTIITALLGLCYRSHCRQKQKFKLIGVVKDRRAITRPNIAGLN